MGYSNRIGFIPKRVYNKIKRLSYDDLMKFYNVEKEEYEDKPHLSISDIVEELHEIGLYSSDKLDEIKQKKDTLFKQLMCDHKETYEDYWRTHNDNGYDIICKNCNFILETK